MTIYFMSASTLIKGTLDALVFSLVELLGGRVKRGKKSYTKYFICLLNYKLLSWMFVLKILESVCTTVNLVYRV